MPATLQNQSAPSSGSPGVTFNVDGSVSEKILGSVKVDPNARTVATNVRTHALSLRSPASISNPTDVIYHGGPTLFNAGSVNVYVNPATNPAPLQWSWPGGFIGRFSLSKLNHIMDQYTGATKDNRYPYLGGLSLTDGATGTWGNTQINQIIQAAINATGNTGYRVVYHIFLVSGQQVCTTAPYPVGCYGTAYCAFHGSGDFSGTVSGHVIFTVEPWQQITGCKAPTDTVQTDTANTLSNEMSEAFTDPDSNAWYNAAGNEIGDICKTSYGNIPLYPNFIVYNIQKEWLNSQHACAYGPTGFITEFSAGITPGSEPTGITSGPDGNLWFAELANPPAGNKIGRITPVGVVTEFSNGITARSEPDHITSGPDGNLWFTEYGQGIGRITPSGGVTEFSGGFDGSPDGITGGPDGNLWFTQQGTQDVVGRITTSGGMILFSVPTLAQPGGIASGPDGNLWFPLSTQSNDAIVRTTPSGTSTQFGKSVLANSSPVEITRGPDGNLWFTEARGNRIGRITPAGVIAEFSAGISANSQPEGITSGPDGNLWFTEATGNRIGRITTAGVVTEFSSGITANGKPTIITTGQDGNLWFTEFNASKIGRLIP